LYYDANITFRILVKMPRNPGLRSRSVRPGHFAWSWSSK